MSNGMYWLRGPWNGQLAITARPRGGDWLEDEVRSWQQQGISTVVSLLTPEEEHEFHLEAEGRETTARGMKFLGVPVPDRDVPDSEAELEFALHEVETTLASGNNALVHCRQGIGRSGLFAACLLVNRNWSPKEATDKLTELRGTPVPETAEQRRWIDRYAAYTQAAQSRRKAV